MTFRRISVAVFFVLCLLSIAQAAYYYPLLPERIASHFGPTGRPDAWSTKAPFLVFYFAIVGILILLFSTIIFAVSRIPVSFINLPNREYWLSPERKQQTLDYLVSSFLWFASATMLLLLDIMRQEFQVHLGQATTLSHPVLSLGVYIGFTTIWTIGFLIKFIKKNKRSF